MQYKCQHQFCSTFFFFFFLLKALQTFKKALHLDPQNKEVKLFLILNTTPLKVYHVYFCILHQIREEDLKWAQELVKQKEAMEEQPKAEEDGSERDRQ